MEKGGKIVYLDIMVGGLFGRKNRQKKHGLMLNQVIEARKEESVYNN